MEINAIATVAFFGVLLAYVTLKENKPQKTASWPIAPLDVRRRALEKRDRELKESEQNRFNE